MHIVYIIIMITHMIMNSSILHYVGLLVLSLVSGRTGVKLMAAIIIITITIIITILIIICSSSSNITIIIAILLLLFFLGLGVLLPRIARQRVARPNFNNVISSKSSNS